MLAAKIWITDFRAIEFPHGATGCAQDHRDATATGADLRQATKLATEILRENHDAIIKLADKIDTTATGSANDKLPAPRGQGSTSEALRSVPGGRRCPIPPNSGGQPSGAHSDA